MRGWARQSVVCSPRPPQMKSASRVELRSARPRACQMSGLRWRRYRATSHIVARRFRCEHPDVRDVSPDPVGFSDGVGAERNCGHRGQEPTPAAIPAHHGCNR